MNRWLVVSSLFLLTASGCGRPPAGGEHAHSPDEGWSVTAWGQRYEVFAETDALVAGRPATSNVHVTGLADFSPLKAGAVSAVLRGPSSREQRFRQERSKREGIFPVELKPSSEGTFELLFVIEREDGSEEIPAGRVRVGSAAAPGGLVEPKEQAANSVPFLKEQQWRTEFASAWVTEGALSEAVTGPGRVLPARGGDVVLTASIDAVVAPDLWSYRGMDVARGAAIFRLVPRAGDRSLLELRADTAALEADVGAARTRVERLTELVRLEASSPAELERARASLAGLEARLAAAQRGAAVASESMQSGAQPAEVRAPWAGRVAEVSVSPGQTVVAGTILGRIVKPSPLWLEVALRPEDAPRLKGGLSGVNLRRATVPEPQQFAREQVRLVAVAPQVDPQTAALITTLQVEASVFDLPIGTAVEAEILLGGERRGVVIPQSALVDDAGVAVAYVQHSGETFIRREVRVLARQGARALVTGLQPGDRLATRGGAAIRRSSLLSSGAPEGHVH